MHRVVTVLFLATANFAWAHPGHDALWFHWHGWDVGHLMVGLAVVAVAALAAWKVK